MKHLDNLIARYPLLEECKSDISKAFDILVESYRKGGKLIVAGNGGSAADAEHIVGELMKGFKKKRRIDPQMEEDLMRLSPENAQELTQHLQKALPAIALDSHIALNTAFINDQSALSCFAQQVYGYANANDVFLAISTSGNSKNIINAAITAKAINIPVIGLTGKDGGALKKFTDVCIRVPEDETFIVQELHLPVYHCLCLMLEEHFFDV